MTTEQIVRHSKAIFRRLRHLSIANCGPFSVWLKGKKCSRENEMLGRNAMGYSELIICVRQLPFSVCCLVSHGRLSRTSEMFFITLYKGLYGITCLQTYVYYRKGQRDHVSFKAIIYFLWLLDTFHLTLITHSLYFYLITSYANPVQLLFPTWSILSQVYVTVVSDLIVRGIYARRVWIIITATSLVTAGAGTAFATLAFIDKTFANFSHISYLMYTSLGSAVAADIVIAASLCISLSRSRTGFKTTDNMVSVLMMPVDYVRLFRLKVIIPVILSLSFRLCATACFITYTIWPTQFTFIGIYFCLSKLFFNSLLAMLNGRSSLKKRANGFSDIPVQLSAPSSTRPMEFGPGSTWASKDTYTNQADSEGLSVR
ncbi:hypothetical protein CPB84DRAFT_721957 [Gymnopilus junonius]|uniref:DUF6534 domain-containing protein n=1 Tax=Gymnopilus junonius TaxID=109634 RepID=A0A9P5TNQ0_GYMJU|nr:hypothetical protein CPB84DRAFT_721957 [Gymnopilus junonius]